MMYKGGIFLKRIIICLTAILFLFTCTVIPAAAEQETEFMRLEDIGTIEAPLLAAVRADYHNDTIISSDILPSYVYDIGSGLYLTELSVKGYGYYSVMIYEQIGGYIHTATSPVPQILVSDTATLYDLSDAYDSGIIDDKMLDRLSTLDELDLVEGIYEEPTVPVPAPADHTKPAVTAPPAEDIPETMPEILSTDVEVYTIEGDRIALGDADGDGTVSIADATCIQRHLAFFSTGVIELGADADGDGTVSIADATRIQRYLGHLCTITGEPVG